MLNKQPESPYGSPTFVIPKKDNTVRVVTNFQEVNKTIVRTPYPVPKISTVLQEMDEFTYTTSLDPNMGYYPISRGALSLLVKNKFLKDMFLSLLSCHLPQIAA